MPLAEPACGGTREGVHQCGDGHFRRVLHQQVDVIVFAVALREYDAEVLAYLPEDPAR
jgi:hypothetical protein